MKKVRSSQAAILVLKWVNWIKQIFPVSIVKKEISNFIKMKESLNLCDIWRIRNPKSKWYTFRQNHSSGFIQRRLNHFFVSNVQQECVKKKLITELNWWFFCHRSFTDSFFLKSDEWIFSWKRLMERPIIKQGVRWKDKGTYFVND